MEGSEQWNNTIESVVNEDISGSNLSGMALKGGETKSGNWWDALVIIYTNSGEVLNYGKQWTRK